MSDGTLSALTRSTAALTADRRRRFALAADRRPNPVPEPWKADNDQR